MIPLTSDETGRVIWLNPDKILRVSAYDRNTDKAVLRFEPTGVGDFVTNERVADVIEKLDQERRTRVTIDQQARTDAALAWFEANAPKLREMLAGNELAGPTIRDTGRPLSIDRARQVENDAAAYEESWKSAEWSALKKSIAALVAAATHPGDPDEAAIVAVDTLVLMESARPSSRAAIVATMKFEGNPNRERAVAWESESSEAIYDDGIKHSRNPDTIDPRAYVRIAGEWERRTL